MLGQVLRVKGYYDITGLTSMILNGEYFAFFMSIFEVIYDVMIGKNHSESACGPQILD